MPDPRITGDVNYMQIFTGKRLLADQRGVDEALMESAQRMMHEMLAYEGRPEIKPGCHYEVRMSIFEIDPDA